MNISVQDETKEWDGRVPVSLFRDDVPGLESLSVIVHDGGEDEASNPMLAFTFKAKVNGEEMGIGWGGSDVDYPSDFVPYYIGENDKLFNTHHKLLCPVMKSICDEIYSLW